MVDLFGPCGGGSSCVSLTWRVSLAAQMLHGVREPRRTLCWQLDARTGAGRISRRACPDVERAATVLPVRNKRHEERTIRMDAEPLPPSWAQSEGEGGRPVEVSRCAAGVDRSSAYEPDPSAMSLSVILRLHDALFSPRLIPLLIELGRRSDAVVHVVDLRPSPDAADAAPGRSPRDAGFGKNGRQHALRE